MPQFAYSEHLFLQAAGPHGLAATTCSLAHVALCPLSPRGGQTCPRLGLSGDELWFQDGGPSSVASPLCAVQAEGLKAFPLQPLQPNPNSATCCRGSEWSHQCVPNSEHSGCTISWGGHTHHHKLRGWNHRNSSFQFWRTEVQSKASAGLVPFEAPGEGVPRPLLDSGGGRSQACRRPIQSLLQPHVAFSCVSGFPFLSVAPGPP